MGKPCDSIGILRTSELRRKRPFLSGKEWETESVIDIYPLHREKVEELRGASHVFVFYPLSGETSDGSSVGEAGVRPETSTGEENKERAIGRLVLRLNGILGSLLVVQGIELRDRTPILDIRPFRVDSRLCPADCLY